MKIKNEYIFCIKLLQHMATQYTFTAENVLGNLADVTGEFTYCTLEVTGEEHPKNIYELVILINLQSTENYAKQTYACIKELFDFTEKAGISCRLVIIGENITTYKTLDNVSMSTFQQPSNKLSILYNLIRGANYIAKTTDKIYINIHVYVLINNVAETPLVEYLYNNVRSFSYCVFDVNQKTISALHSTAMNIKNSNYIYKDLINYKVFGDNADTFNNQITKMSSLLMVNFTIEATDRAYYMLGSRVHNNPYIGNKYVVILFHYLYSNINVNFKQTSDGAIIKRSFNIANGGKMTDKHKHIYYSMIWPAITLNILKWWTDPIAIPYRSKKIMYDIPNFRKNILGDIHNMLYFAIMSNDVLCVVVNYYI